MDKSRKSHRTAENKERRPLGIRLPGFITDEEIGLGDVIKNVTMRMGIKPCGGCKRRTETLNSWLIFRR